jgi:hypothetical protein
LSEVIDQQQQFDRTNRNWEQGSLFRLALRDGNNNNLGAAGAAPAGQRGSTSRPLWPTALPTAAQQATCPMRPKARASPLHRLPATSRLLASDATWPTEALTRRELSFSTSRARASSRLQLTVPCATCNATSCAPDCRDKAATIFERAAALPDLHHHLGRQVGGSAAHARGLG